MTVSITYYVTCDGEMADDVCEASIEKTAAGRVDAVDALFEELAQRGWEVVYPIGEALRVKHFCPLHRSKNPVTKTEIERGPEPGDSDDWFDDED